MRPEVPQDHLVAGLALAAEPHRPARRSFGRREHDAHCRFLEACPARGASPGALAAREGSPRGAPWPRSPSSPRGGLCASRRHGAGAVGAGSSRDVPDGRQGERSPRSPSPGGQAPGRDPGGASPRASRPAPLPPGSPWEQAAGRPPPARDWQRSPSPRWNLWRMDSSQVAGALGGDAGCSQTHSPRCPTSPWAERPLERSPPSLSPRRRSPGWEPEAASPKASGAWFGGAPCPRDQAAGRLPPVERQHSGSPRRHVDPWRTDSSQVASALGGNALDTGCAQMLSPRREGTPKEDAFGHGPSSPGLPQQCAGGPGLSRRPEDRWRADSSQAPGTSGPLPHSPRCAGQGQLWHPEHLRAEFAGIPSRLPTASLSEVARRAVQQRAQPLAARAAPCPATFAGPGRGPEGCSAASTTGGRRDKRRLLRCKHAQGELSGRATTASLQSSW